MKIYNIVHMSEPKSWKKKSCGIKVWSQILTGCVGYVYPKSFLFGAVYKSTKLDCSPSAWDNKPVFDPGCRNHIILWGGFNFFLLLAKPPHSYSLKGNIWLHMTCVLWKIHTKIKRMHLNPVPSYCRVLMSVLSTTFCDNLKASLILSLRVFTSTDLVSVLSWHFSFSSFDLGLKNVTSCTLK